MKIKKGDYIKSTEIDGVAKVLSDDLDDERQLLAVFDSSIEVDHFSGFYFDNAEPITKEEFDAAFEKTMKFLESVK